MKVTTLILSAVAALGFSALQASASIGTTVDYSSLSCSITVNTNKPQVNLPGGISSQTSAQARIGNKQLLDLFAMWVGADRTTAPWNNARLVVGWDWDWAILVVDQTGTNVLFDTSEGVDNASFNVDFFDEYGDGNWTGADATPGFYFVNDTDYADWELYDDEGSIPYTDLWGDGSNSQSFRQQWDAHDHQTWSDNEDAVFGWTGDQVFLDIYEGATRISTKAEFTATGSGTGYNYVGWAD